MPDKLEKVVPLYRQPRSSNLNNTISRCAKLRVEAGMTQTKLSVASGVNLQAVMKIEKGHVQKMQLETLIRVSLALNVAPVELVPALGYKPRRITTVPKEQSIRTHEIREAEGTDYE